MLQSALNMFLRYSLIPMLILVASGDTMAQADSSSATGKAALIYGAGHALTVRAPEGWTLDSRSGRAQGLQSVFYPNGQKWKSSPAVMYCLVVPRGSTIADRNAMIAYDVERFRNGSPTAAVTEQESIALGKKESAIRQFTGGASGSFEQRAYIEERTVVVMLVLSCRSQEMLDTSLPAFSQLVGSYTFLADDEENILRAIEAAEE